MRHVFISYQHEEQDFTKNLIRRLEKTGFQIWSDHKIAAGEEWRTAIDQAIRTAFALIVIMTPQAKLSEYITYEWAFAWGIGIKVIPIILRKTELHPRLEALQYLDFTNKNKPWDKLVEELNSTPHTPLIYTTNIAPTSPSDSQQTIITLDSTNQTIPSSTNALNDTDSKVRIEETRSLRDTKDISTVPALINDLNHDDMNIRIEAARSLGNIKDSSAVPALINVLDDTDDDDDFHIVLREEAAISLGNIKDPSAIPVLINALNYDETEVRIEAARSLGNIKDPSAVPALINVLDDTELDTILRKVAARSLGNIKDPSVVPTLINILNHDHTEVRRIIAKTLRILGAQNI